jgi:hypothetical protein
VPAFDKLALLQLRLGKNFDYLQINYFLNQYKKLAILGTKLFFHHQKSLVYETLHLCHHFGTASIILRYRPAFFSSAV